MAAYTCSTNLRASRPFRGHQVAISETAFRTPTPKPVFTKPLRYTFPASDDDWCARNLPIVRAAVGIVGQDGAELVNVHREASRSNPSYASDIVGELNERIAHFETLIRVMRLARHRVEAAAALADAIEGDEP